MIWVVCGLSMGAQAGGTLTGVVTNLVTGTGIVGARITVNGLVTYSVSNGVYSLTVDPPGTYSVGCTKAGYNGFTSPPVTITSGSTSVLNIQMQEQANSPESAMAGLDTAIQTVHVNWSLPVGDYELLYDDGIQDQFSVWATQGNMNGVRFSPPGYPAQIRGGSVNLGTSSNYPPGSNPLVPFQVAVFDATGPSGLPGTMIGGPFDIVPTHYGWFEFTFPVTVTVTSGNFYLVMIQGGNAPDAAGLAVDLTYPQFRSVQRFIAGGGPWVPAGGNFMLRAVVEGPGGPVDFTDESDALLGYHVWRLRQGEEQNPIVWADLGMTDQLTLDDPAWPGFPCGAYLWAVKARYSGDRYSAVTWSNVVQKCWTSAVTVQAELTCLSGDKSGTGVRLNNLVYPDTSYVSVMDTSGIVLFPNVWKGTYHLVMEKFGYQTQTLILPVSHDTAVTALLLQEKPPPRDLEMGEKNLVAYWRLPEYRQVLFSEDWTSASFQTNGWTPEGGNNWVISSVAGNPAPSAMFGWSPQVFNYDQSLVSPEIDTRFAPVLLLGYDITLDNFGTTTDNEMAVEVWDGTGWAEVASYNNHTGSIPWKNEVVDVSAFAGLSLSFRFRATGGDSYDINAWNIDNIRLEGSETQAGLMNCVLGYNVYLDQVLSGFTTDTKYTIPGDQVRYGQTYNLCVNAVYGSGWSDLACVPFTSLFLWPPKELNGTVIENSIELTWAKPEMHDSTGQMVTPPGLVGYRIYRNSVLIDSVTSPETLFYYDLQLEPGNYSYEVTARYDLALYGFPGQFDESMPAGPVTFLINFGRPLPFAEPWNKASFSYNNWQFVPEQGNWTINTAAGNPAPSAQFSWDPLRTDYKYSLQSPALDGTPYHCGTICLDFDLSAEVINPTGHEKLNVELYYDDMWHNVAAFQNDSSFTWSHRTIDISEVAGHGFLIGFKANGSNSADIQYWRMDNIYVHAVCFGPTDLEPDAQGFDVHLTWRPPDCTGSNMYLSEGFEGGIFPPESWARVITDTASTWAQMSALSPVGAHSGSYSAGVIWDYVHQDEWLIAENVVVNGNLEFWSFGFQGSVHMDHYYVKISTDEGLNWTILADLSAMPPYPGPGGYNQWNEPYVIDLAAYLGDVVSVAWQAIDGDGQGLWYSWAIDDCYIGNKKLDPKPAKHQGAGHSPDVPETLMGYNIFRRDPGTSDFLRVNVNTVSDTFYVDPGLNPGQYEYYISPVFNECTESVTSDTSLVDVITSVIPPGESLLRVYPVPASDHLTIECPQQIMSLKLLDINGSTILTREPFEEQAVIDVAGIPAGSYVLFIITASECYHHVVIIY